MRTLICALIAAACVALPTLAQPKSGQKPEKDVEFPKDEPLEVNDEADQLLRAMRDRMRVHYAKTGTAPASLSRDVGVTAKEMKGEEFTVADTVYSKDNSGGVMAEPHKAGAGIHFLKFDWSSGKGKTAVYATMKELQAANTEFTWADDKAADASKKAAEQWDALYKVGAKWTLKLSMSVEIWQSTEVIKVVGNTATTKVSTKMKDGDWMPATEHEVKRPTISGEAPAASPAGYKEIARGEEKVGDWDCDFVEFEFNGKRSKTYHHKTYGLLIKLMDGDTVKMLVTEFTPAK